MGWQDYEILTIDGREFAAIVEPDDYQDPPWLMEDGHGIVSEWTGRDKRPGEIVLHADGSRYLYYDFAATLKKARKEGWGTSDGKRPNETARQYTERAVRADFDYLRRWCKDDWYYVVVGVAPIVDGEPDTDRAEYLGGVEFDYQYDYWREVAEQIAHRIMADLDHETHELRFAASLGVPTLIRAGTRELTFTGE